MLQPRHWRPVAQPAAAALPCPEIHRQTANQKRRPLLIVCSVAGRAIRVPMWQTAERKQSEQGRTWPPWLRRLLPRCWRPAAWPVRRRWPPALPSPPPPDGTPLATARGRATLGPGTGVTDSWCPFAMHPFAHASQHRGPPALLLPLFPDRTPPLAAAQGRSAWAFGGVVMNRSGVSLGVVQGGPLQYALTAWASVGPGGGSKRATSLKRCKASSTCPEDQTCEQGWVGSHWFLAFSPHVA